MLEEIEERVRDIREARGIPASRRARRVLVLVTATAFYRKAIEESDAATCELAAAQLRSQAAQELLDELRAMLREIGPPVDGNAARGRRAAMTRLRLARDRAYVVSARAALRVATARELEHRAALVVEKAAYDVARNQPPPAELVPDHIDFGKG